MTQSISTDGASPEKHEAIDVIQNARGKPNYRVKIYRAVPKVLTVQQEIDEYEKQKAYIQKHGKVPSYVDTTMHRSDYYGKISDIVEKLKKKAAKEPPPEKIRINKGDWVTPSQDYAKSHGRSQFNSRYRILTKTVKAKDLYTDGNSILEWGYDP